MSRKTNPGRHPGWHWSEYWQSGRTEIVTVDTADGSAPFDPGPSWQAFFATFPNGARLIDLATGGGQVARLAHSTAASLGKTFDIVGVDYADLGPSGGELAPGLRLMGGVGLERLPFEDATFDGATSQYGIEYADTRAAVAEMARVLRPGGRARLLMHHVESAVSRSTAAQTAAHDRVMPDDALIQKARRAYSAYLKPTAPAARESSAETFREGIRRATGKLRDDPEYGTVRYHLEYLTDLANGLARYEPRSALARLEIFEAGVAAWHRRHRNQMTAALDAAGLDTFLHRARSKGLETIEAVTEQDGRGALIAWRVDLRKV